MPQQANARLETAPNETNKPNASTDFPFANVQDADVLTDISYKRFIEEYAIPGRPAIIRGALAELAASQWTPELMTQRWGNKMFEIEGKSLPFADIVAALVASTPDKPAPYFRSVDIETEFPELIPDLAPGIKYAWPNYRLLKSLFPEWYFETGGHFAEFFFGGQGNGFPFMHADHPPMHTFITLFYGTKEWIGFSPDQADNLYLEDPGEDKYICSEIDDIFNPDFDKYPKLKNTRPVRALQQAGDLVFMPCNWIHTVRNLSPTISVAFDQLAHSCWDQFVEDKLDATVKKSATKARLVNLYFRSLGGTLGLAENLARRSNKESFRGRII